MSVTEEDFVEIRFTDEDMEFIRSHSSAITDNKKHLPNIKANLHTPKLNDEDRMYLGMKGEVAYAKYIGLKKESVGDVLDGGDGGFDFKHQFVGTVDVKATDGRKRELLRINPKLEADIYVLVWPNESNSVTIIGWTNLELFNDMSYRMYPEESDSTTMAVKWYRLKPISELKELILNSHSENSFIDDRLS